MRRRDPGCATTPPQAEGQETKRKRRDKFRFGRRQRHGGETPGKRDGERPVHAAAALARAVTALALPRAGIALRAAFDVAPFNAAVSASGTTIAREWGEPVDICAASLDAALR